MFEVTLTNRGGVVRECLDDSHDKPSLDVETYIGTILLRDIYIYQICRMAAEAPPQARPKLLIVCLTHEVSDLALTDEQRPNVVGNAHHDFLQGSVERLVNPLVGAVRDLVALSGDEARRIRTLEHRAA